MDCLQTGEKKFSSGAAYILSTPESRLKQEETSLEREELQLEKDKLQFERERLAFDRECEANRHQEEMAKLNLQKLKSSGKWLLSFATMMYFILSGKAFDFNVLTKALGF